MLIEYDFFVKTLNNKLFEESSSKLLDKIAHYPERFVGIFRPTKPKTKLIQNITQSHEIKFGDALEDIFEKYFEKMGFVLLPKRFLTNETSDEEEYNIDQLFQKDNDIYLIEQKVRDDHDSTKKKGQFENFENKYYEVTCKYPDNNVIPIMWFIDPSLKKNKKYYSEEMEKMGANYGCSPKLYYGEELFDCNPEGIPNIKYEMWVETTDYLVRWKETLPDMPEVNLDLNAEAVFEEIKNLKPSIFRKLLENEDVVEQIFPILFPQKKVLLLLEKEFENRDNQRIYSTLAQKIDEILE